MRHIVKGNIILYLLLLIIAVSLMVITKRCSTPTSPQPRDYNQIADDTLRLVTTIYTSDEVDFANVLNYEIAELVGKASGLTYKIDTISSIAQSIELLNSNKYDVVAHPIFATAENKNQLLLTNSFETQNSLVVVQRKEGEIKSNLDLAGKEIHIVDGRGITKIMENLAAETGDSINIVKEQDISVEQLIVMVANGTIDYAVCDVLEAKMMKTFIPEIDYDTKITVPLPQAWGVRLTSPVLCDSLNLWLEKIKKSNDFKKLVNKYSIK